jgi:hypothetical protein
VKNAITSDNQARHYAAFRISIAFSFCVFATRRSTAQDCNTLKNLALAKFSASLESTPEEGSSETQILFGILCINPDIVTSFGYVLSNITFLV